MGRRRTGRSRKRWRRTCPRRRTTGKLPGEAAGDGLVSLGADVAFAASVAIARSTWFVDLAGSTSTRQGAALLAVRQAGRAGLSTVTASIIASDEDAPVERYAVAAALAVRRVTRRLRVEADRCPKYRGPPCTHRRGRTKDTRDLRVRRTVAFALVPRQRRIHRRGSTHCNCSGRSRYPEGIRRRLASASVSSSPVASSSRAKGDVEPSSDDLVVAASSPAGTVTSSPEWPFWPPRVPSPASSPSGPPRSSARRLERPHPSARLTTAQSPNHRAFGQRPSATGAVGDRLRRESRRSIGRMRSRSRAASSERHALLIDAAAPAQAPTTVAVANSVVRRSLSNARVARLPCMRSGGAHRDRRFASCLRSPLLVLSLVARDPQVRSPRDSHVHATTPSMLAQTRSTVTAGAPRRFASARHARSPSPSPAGRVEGRRSRDRRRVLLGRG